TRAWKPSPTPRTWLVSTRATPGAWPAGPGAWETGWATTSWVETSRRRSTRWSQRPPAREPGRTVRIWPARPHEPPRPSARVRRRRITLRPAADGARFPHPPHLPPDGLLGPDRRRHPPARL